MDYKGHFLKEPFNTSLDNNILQHICGSYNFFCVFFKCASIIFLGYFWNILGLSNEKR